MATSCNFLNSSPENPRQLQVYRGDAPETADETKPAGWDVAKYPVEIAVAKNGGDLDSPNNNNCVFGSIFGPLFMETLEYAPTEGAGNRSRPLSPPYYVHP